MLIILCMTVVVGGGIQYIVSLRKNLTEQAIGNVLTVTVQQQQAFDNFISEDQERLHSYADYFSHDLSTDTEHIRSQLTAFYEVDAFYSVIDLDTGYFYSNKSDEIYRMQGAELETYRSFSGSGVRDPYTGLYSDHTMFGYYECFTFADGVRGLIQKSYDRSKVSEAFSLSFYDNQGLSYVVNSKGEILVRSIGMLGDRYYDTIFDMLSDNYDEHQKIQRFMQALEQQQTGSMVFNGAKGEYVYTYVPVNHVESWSLVSIVPKAVIVDEANEILIDSQQVFAALSVLLLACGVSILLIWRTHKDMQAKDLTIDYQEQMFNIFATYLSSNTGDVYMMIDMAEDKIEYISPNAKWVLGISPQTIKADLGLFSGAVYASGEKADFSHLHRMLPGTSLGKLSTEWVNPETEEQKWFQMQVYCTLVQNKRKIVVYISDRTQERTVQNTLTEALKMAQVANSAKSSFLSSMSHDIRTPMNAIIGFVELLREEAEHPDMVREYTQRIDAASQHLLSLINDVLDMNKIESGNATLNLSEINLADVIDEINTIIRPQTKAKEQTFEIFAASVRNEQFQADKLRINQILINLLSNAVKYTQVGGSIQMRVDELPQVLEDYSRIRFTVRDNGMGMSEEYQKVIFEPFTREDTAVSNQIQGTGLGMAITKSLVDLMGGTIEVHSKLDQGTTFLVELELYIHPKEDDSDFWTRHHVHRMIVADDDEEICRGIVKAMAGTNVAVDYSTSGEHAIQMMRENREAGRPYDLILLDWKMPDLNGLETARLIRKNYSDKIPILLFTAYDWSDIEQEATDIGINHFMPKPFFVANFKDSIRRVRGKMKQQQENSQDSQVVMGKHILVVDDIEVNRMILVKILSSLGATCEVAVNGQEAVNKFQGSSPGAIDLILMDVQMPILDGYQATRAIRTSDHPEAETIPIIAMTANAFVDDVRDAIESGMDAHIAKPIQLDKLKSTVRQVFDSRQGQQKEQQGQQNERRLQS